MSWDAVADGAALVAVLFIPHVPMRDAAPKALPAEA